jgi:hypothetical protein
MNRKERKAAAQAEYQASLAKAEEALAAQALVDATPLPPGTVRTFKITGDEELQDTMQKYLANGWDLLSHTTRKRAWAPVMGVFTADQVHTVTFVRKGEGA